MVSPYMRTPSPQHAYTSQNFNQYQMMSQLSPKHQQMSAKSPQLSPRMQSQQGHHQYVQVTVGQRHHSPPNLPVQSNSQFCQQVTSPQQPQFHTPQHQSQAYMQQLLIQQGQHQQMLAQQQQSQLLLQPSMLAQSRPTINIHPQAPGQNPHIIQQQRMIPPQTVRLPNGLMGQPIPLPNGMMGIRQTNGQIVLLQGTGPTGNPRTTAETTSYPHSEEDTANPIPDLLEELSLENTVSSTNIFHIQK